jgi:DNA-binding transcriptional ArsR family regulator
LCSYPVISPPGFKKRWSVLIIKGFFRITPKFSPNSNINKGRRVQKNTFITSSQVTFEEEFFEARRLKNVMEMRVRLKYLLGWLIAGTRGGPTRAKIILALKETPQNANQLATLLKMDYKTMRHHLEVLEKNKIITSVGDRYGATYFLSQMMEDNYVLFEEIVKKIGKK